MGALNFKASRVLTKIIHLCKRSKQFLVSHGLGVSWSHWSRQPADVVDVDVSIGFVDGWLPFHQRGGGQVAEGAQVKVPWVAQSERDKKYISFWFLITWTQARWWRWSIWSVHNQQGNEGSQCPPPWELWTLELSKDRMFSNSSSEKFSLS